MTNEEAIRYLIKPVATSTEIGEEKQKEFEAYNIAIEALKTVQEHKGTFEWCVECKEYDQEQHCCHRWTKQIWKTIAEWEEENGIVRCSECKYAEFCEKKIHRHGIAYSIDFCSYGKHREDGEEE